MIRVLFAGRSYAWADYETVLPRAIADAGVAAEVVRDADPASVDYIVYAPNSKVQDFAPYTKTKAVLNLWAGVEGIVGNKTLTQPLARMVDYGLTEGMVEWCVAQVLRHHLNLDRDVCRTDRQWAPHVPPLARDRRVTVLGLGELGCTVADALSQLNFSVTGWSRNRKSLHGVTCFAGDDALEAAMIGSEIVVLLLPLTSATENVLNAKSIGLLAKGAFVINPGRGPLIDDDALVAALDSGQLAHATLDVFREEPLPEWHVFWTHPRVTVTPHVASATRPESSARVIAENIRRGESGEPFLHLVDREAGY